MYIHIWVCMCMYRYASGSVAHSVQALLLQRMPSCLAAWLGTPPCLLVAWPFRCHRAASNATISLPPRVTISRNKPSQPLTVTQQLLTIAGPATGTPAGTAGGTPDGTEEGSPGGKPEDARPLLDCGGGPCLDAVCNGTSSECQLSLRNLRVANGVAPSGGCLHTVGYSVQAR